MCRRGTLARVAALYALAWHPVAHAQRIPVIVVAVLAALLVSPLLAMALKWATLRGLGEPARARGLWLACALDGALWLVALPVAWTLWDRHGLTATLVVLLVISTMAHHWLIAAPDGASVAPARRARSWSRSWSTSLLLAIETPVLGALLAMLAWVALFF